MTSTIDYQNIFSRFYSKVKAYDLISKDEAIVTQTMDEWLHAGLAKPIVKRLFKSMELDDEIQKFTYELNANSNGDDEFVTEILALGMVIEWVSPKVHNTLLFAQLFSSSDSKFYSQSQHLSVMQDILTSSEARQNQMIADYNASWNTYLANTQ